MAKRRTVQKANFGEIAANAARMVGRLSEEGGLVGRVGRGLSGASQAVSGLGEGVRNVGRRVRNSLANANPFGGNPTTPRASQGVPRTPAQYVGTPEEYLRRNPYDMQASGVGERFGGLMAGINPFGDEAMSASFLQGLMGTPEEYLRRNAPPPRKYKKPVYGNQELQLPLEKNPYYTLDLENMANSGNIEDIMPWGQALYSANSPFPKDLFDEIKEIQRANPALDGSSIDVDSGTMAAVYPIQRGKGMTPVARGGLNPNWRNNSNPDWQFPETIDNYWQNIYEPTNQRVSRGNTAPRPRSRPSGVSQTRQGYRRFNEIIADAKANPPLPTEPVPYNTLLNAYQNPRSDLYNYRTDPTSIAYRNAQDKAIDDAKQMQLAINDNILKPANMLRYEITSPSTVRAIKLMDAVNSMKNYAINPRTDAEFMYEVMLTNPDIARRFTPEEIQGFRWNSDFDKAQRKNPNLSREDQITLLTQTNPDLRNYYNSLQQSTAKTPQLMELQRKADDLKYDNTNLTPDELLYLALKENNQLAAQLTKEEQLKLEFNARLSANKKYNPNASEEDLLYYVFSANPHLRDYYNSLQQSAGQPATQTVAEQALITTPRGKKGGLNPKWADLNGGMGKSMGKRDTINKFMDNSFAKSMSKPFSNKMPKPFSNKMDADMAITPQKVSTNRSIKSSNKYFN